MIYAAQRPIPRIGGVHPLPLRPKVKIFLAAS